MKSIILHAVAALAVAMVFAGCANVPYEGAMEWMQKQPQLTDP